MEEHKLKEDMEDTESEFVEPEGNLQVEGCEPCGYAIAAGMLLNEFCGIEGRCKDLQDEFLTGTISLSELASRVGASSEYLDYFKNQGIDIDRKEDFSASIPQEEE